MAELMVATMAEMMVDKTVTLKAALKGDRMVVSTAASTAASMVVQRAA